MTGKCPMNALVPKLGSSAAVDDITADVVVPQAEYPPATQTSIAVLSKFTVANGKEDEVKVAFKSRPHLVEKTVGFLRMDVICPTERPAEIWLLTYWADRESLELWHNSHLHKQSHHGIPPGLKLLRGATSLAVFDFISS